MTGEELRDKRASLGMTQQELADALDIPQPRVSEMERDKREVSRLIQLALWAIEHGALKKRKR